MSDKKAKTVTTITAIIVGVLTFYGVRYFLFEDNIEDVLQEAAVKINREAPLQLDEETRMDSAAVSGKRNLDYYYTLIYKSTEVNKDTVNKYVKPLLIERVKSSSEMNYLKDQNVIFTYNYYGYDGKPAVRIQISPDMYKN